MKIDYHTHHERCGHAKGSLRDMIEAAVALGLDQIGLADHSPFFHREEDRPVPDMTMAKSEFPRYVAEMARLREEYKGRIDVRLGVESDYIPGWAEAYGRIYADYPLDYIIGSVHYVDGIHVFSRRRWQQGNTDPEETYAGYLRLLHEAVRSRQYDIMGHIDAVKGVCPHPVRVLWEETVGIIAESDAAVEINTSGLRKPCQAWFPSLKLIELLIWRNVPLTFGSDAHDPEQLAYDWEHVVTALRELGVRELAAFRRRRRTMVPLPSRMI
ncbi:PHP domain-containing protein [Paenibacillus sp. H1-7]|uniref:histidinol-phosphatase n=1 Tax=Paenibacillus sp. H1-7 TaxID=2282849 RepID=UPI001EF80D8D|nr:histidinol-phosphatase [Paenibacillus sp. H1-7]ULL18574.1 PHP domain-containing protein [Paenibacillus sp. H1-7]